MVKRLTGVFWLCAAIIVRPLMALLELIPNWKKPQAWWWLKDRFAPFEIWEGKKVALVLGGVLVGMLLWFNTPAGGWMTWWEWQTFSGAREDQPGGGTTATTGSDSRNRAGIYISGPEKPRYNGDENDGKPRPVILTFPMSAAPLDSVGKEAQDVEMSPELAGKWTWTAANRLEFLPEQEWPIGERFAVTLGDKALAPHVSLSDDTVIFHTPGFQLNMRSAIFYQDPEQVTLRKAVFDVGFSHPVNPATFEKNLSISADGGVSGFFSKMLGGAGSARKFTVTYDKYMMSASVHSEPLPIPESSASLTLIIAEGTRAQQGGNAYNNEIRRAVEIPGLYNLAISEIQHMIVTGENGEPENVLQLTTGMAVRQSEMDRAVSAWVLPLQRQLPDSEQKTNAWNDPADVTEEVLKAAQAVTLASIASERDANEMHAFKFTAEPGRYMLVRIAKGLSSVGGYQLGETRDVILRVKHSAPELSIMSKGSLLAMSGEKKLPIIVRDLPGMRVEIGRLLPQQLQHLVTQSQGDMSKPEFYSGITPDNLSERFEKKIPLSLARGKTHYESIDFSEYLRADASDRRGVFLLTLQGYDPKAGDAQAAEYQQPRRYNRYSEDGEYAGEGDGEEEYVQPAQYEAVNPATMRDSRLVIVTDLGVVSKLALDGSRDVFVQSIGSGQPVGDANVEIWARNGAVLVNQATDSSGMAHLPSVTGMTREKQPVVLVVRKGGDLSFLPLNRYGRNLDTSRFDVGGVHSASLPNQIQAYLFSDRGIYRPGDTINIGIVAKSANWAQKLVDMPVELEVIDARGLVIRRDKLKLGPGGMAEFAHTTQDSSPTGNYTINMNLARDAGSALPGAAVPPALQLGSMTVKVQEFMPDRMKVSASLSSEASEGWVSPADLKARVNVLNLFGTPAANRRVEASLTLSPAYPAFRAYPEFSFTDPSHARESFQTKLERADTNERGYAEFDLGLQRYKQATYQLHVLVNAFEPEGGRTVAAETGTLVSDRPYLIGYKADGDLGYIERNSVRQASFVAIDPKAKKTGVSDLRLVRVERKVVSVLVKQSNGLFRYESRFQEAVLKEDSFTIPAAGAKVSLLTSTPGNFAYVVRDAKGLELSRVNYSVAGTGNVSRSLDRNAELQMTLNRKDYVPGDEIEISIRAPYAGAGLITIERDKVYTHKWFRTTDTASVQRITLPKNFEGNGYVSIQFTRDLASKEIYMSPMSYGVMPFATSLSRRTTPITLKASELIKPGQTAKFTLESKVPSRAMVFAVDEGILQVARYQSPDPLKFFFQKRALEVNTQQTLDLILPEFKRLMQAAAPGGDAEGQLGKHLNPFKRRTDKPVVYWSGIVAVDGKREFSFAVPESFNGSLRVMAVAVNDDTVAAATATTTVRGDIVLLPNVPVAMTPGDEVEIGIGVANNAAGSGKDAPVALSLAVSPGLEVVGPATQTLKISERAEGSTRFRVKAKAGAQAQLGSASVIFSAQVKEAKARLSTDVSVRPASAFITLVQTGMFRGDAVLESKGEMYSNFKRSDAALSGSPWAFTAGLLQYLDVYPHGCTEQITSQTFPAIVLATQPAVAEQLLRLESQSAPGAKKPDPHKTFERYLTQVRARQKADGGIAMWPGNQSDLFATTYVVSLLVEAKERKFTVPNDLLQRANVYLQMRLAEASPHDYNWRVQAQAAYLLARQGVVVSAALNNLNENLRNRVARASNSNQREAMQSDLGAVYLAASFQLLKQDKIAQELLQPALRDLAGNTDPWQRWHWNYYYDPLVYRASTMQLIALHFPEQIKQLPMDFWGRMGHAIHNNYYQSLSAAKILLAVDAYAAAATQAAAGKVALSSVNKAGVAKAIELPQQFALARLAVPVDAARLKMSSGGELPLFYSWAESGYELNVPTEAISKGLEIIHEFLDAEGNVTSEARVGDELTVRVRVRSNDRSDVSQVALVDILPGGMEPVLTAPSDEDEPDMPIWRRRLGGTSTWEIEYADIREDRVIFYGSVNSTLTEVTYKVRATNVGEFVVPAAYGEAMYERRVFGRSAGASFRVHPAD
jgi:uncharacterized protein YfaS (alpha-2-macroglobulin family)